jgi:hypothetical protein
MKKFKLLFMVSFFLIATCKPEQLVSPMPAPSPLKVQMGCKALQNIQGIWREEGTDAVIGFCWNLDNDSPSNKLTVSMIKKNPKAIYALKAGVYTVGKVRIASNKIYHIVSLLQPYPELGGALGNAGALTFDLIDINTIHISSGEVIRWKRIKSGNGNKK